MKSIKFFAASAAGAFALLAPVSVAQAATIVQTNVVPMQTTEVNTNPFTFAGFDSSLGTLNSVRIEFSSDLLSYGSANNHASGPQNVKITAGYDALFTFTGPQSIAGTHDFTVDTGAMDFFNMASGETRTWGPVTGSQADVLNPTDLINFIDTDFSYTFNTMTFISIVGGGNNINTSIDTWAGAQVKVIYDYTAAVTPTVPEPATWALLIAGFGLVGAAARRRGVARTAA